MKHFRQKYNYFADQIALYEKLKKEKHREKRKKKKLRDGSD
jgi:hypothetical protein